MHWNSPSQLQTLQASATRLSTPLPKAGHYISPSASWGLLSCWWDWILPLPRETFPPQTGSGAHSSCAELPRRIKDAALINYCAQLPITAWLLAGCTLCEKEEMPGLLVQTQCWEVGLSLGSCSWVLSCSENKIPEGLLSRHRRCPVFRKETSFSACYFPALLLGSSHCISQWGFIHAFYNSGRERNFILSTVFISFE